MLVSILKDFIEMMHVELLRLLPSRHKVDHTIELVIGAKLLAMTSYQMTPIELK